MIYFSIHLQGAAVSERRHCLHHSTGGSKLVWRGTPRKSGHFPSELCWGVCLLNSAAILLPDCTVLISSFVFVFNFFSFPVFFSSFPSQRRPSQRRVFQCRCLSTERPSPALTSEGTPWWKWLSERLECESLQSHHAFLKIFFLFTPYSKLQPVMLGREDHAHSQSGWKLVWRQNLRHQPSGHLSGHLRRSAAKTPCQKRGGVRGPPCQPVPTAQPQRLPSGKKPQRAIFVYIPWLQFCYCESSKHLFETFFSHISSEYSFLFLIYLFSSSFLPFAPFIALESWIVIVWQPPPCPSLTPIAAPCPQRSTPSPLSGSPWRWEVAAPLPLPRLPYHHCPRCPIAVGSICLRPILPAPCRL